MLKDNLPAWPPNIEPAAVERFKEYLRVVTERRRRAALIEQFSAHVTEDEARIAADAVMEYRRRKKVRI